MARRLQLHEKLCELLGTRNVYFQPPASVKMQYPAIVYSLSSIDSDKANDGVYKLSRSYEVILIDKNPDTAFLGPLSALPMCRFDRYYTADNLNHYVFTLYY
jgi:hypothetical protein